MDKWRYFDNIWKVLLVLGTIYSVLSFIGSIEKDEIGLLIVGIICVINYLRASFESDTKRIMLSIMLMTALLLWSLFGVFVR